MKFKIVALFALITIIAIPSAVHAGFYARPLFGFAIPVTGGDSSYGVGAAVGYGFANRFAIETSYTRHFARGTSFDNNIIEFDGSYSPFSFFISPFFKGGGGFYKASVPGVNTDFEGFIDMGAGVNIDLIPMLDFGAGLSYMALFNAKDLIYPYFYAGLSF